MKRIVSAGLNLKHGYSRARDRTYKSWKEMRQRCNNPRGDKWRWYGGRGIRVCERWDDYLTFLADMGPRPENTTLDRIDPDGNYEPSNCRWATPKQQAETNRGIIKVGTTPPNKTPQAVVDAVKAARLVGTPAQQISNDMGLGIGLVYSLLKR